MLSVRHQHGKIFGIVLCVLLVLSVYTGFVNVVSELFGHSFVETVSLSSRVSSGDGTRFAMGDTISVSAKVSRSNVYRLSVCDNSDRMVFEEAGAVEDSDVEVSVPIRPPVFNAGRFYNLTFEAGVVGLPLLGVSAYDSSPATSFVVVKSLTRLNLSTSYDEVAHDLRSVAVLTTDQGLPVGNVTVSFYVQPNVDFVRPDRGWMLLDSALTDENGSASYSCALSMMGGLHGLEARFQGCQDYGSSTATAQFNVSHAPTLLRIVRAEKTASSVSVVLQLTDPFGFPLGGKVLSFEALSVSAGVLYAVTNDTGYVVMKFSGLVPAYVDSKITVLGDDYISRYQTFVRLIQNGSGMSVASEWGESGAGSLAIGEDGKRPGKAAVFFASGEQALDLSLDPVEVEVENVTPAVDLPERINSTLVQLDAVPGGVTFCYYLNGTLNCSTSATCTWHSTGGGTGFYSYEATFFWYPSVCGDYVVDVLADNSTGDPIGEGNATVSVAPAYNNLVVYYPGAFCGGNMSLVVAFSRARTQSQTDGSGYFQTVNFAPTIVYDNCTYALDQPSQAPIIHLYLNDSEIDLNDTGGTGLCSYTYSTPTLPSNLNVTAAVDQNGRFQASNVSQVFSLTQLTVSDNPAAAADPSSFYMNYSMSVLNGTDITYVNASNLVETQVTVLNTSACNVATSLTTGHLVNRTATSMSAHVNIPVDCTYFRVIFACDNSSKLWDPWCDITKDGKVDIKDITKVAKAFSKSFGYKGYDWTLDWNVDRKIDIKDISTIAKDFGNADIPYLPFHNVTYCPYFDYRGISVGSDKGDVSLDSRGFGQVPPGAQWLNISCKADIEFFSSVVNGSAVTDNSGRAGLTMDATGEGVWVVEDVVAAPLTLTVAVDARVTQMNASLCIANYYYVLKRPLDVSVDFVPEQPTLDDNVTMLASCYDIVLGEPAEGFAVNFYFCNGSINILVEDSVTNDSGVAAFSWNPRSYISEYGWLGPQFVFDFICNETAVTQKVEVVPIVVYAGYPTVLEFLGDPVVNATVGEPCNLSFTLKRADTGDPIGNMHFNLYVNSTSPTTVGTLDDGTYTTPFTPNASGIYYFRAVYMPYAADVYRPSNETRFVVVASVVPTDVLFDVQPHEFEPDTDITLNATVLNASSPDPLNSPLQGHMVTFYEVDADGSIGQIGQNVTNANGVAMLSRTYNSAGAPHAYTATVGAGQQMMTSPVMLTVAKETSLALNVSMSSNFNFTVSGRLLSEGSPVGNRPVGIYANGTLKANVTTVDYYGNFSVSLNLPAINYEQTVYNVQAEFDGDSPCNAAAYSTTPNGTQYAVCTTTQYGYKPSSNCTILTVDPQSALAATLTKSPEEMQEEAQDSGSLLPPQLEFSLWYPWFRLHFIGQVSGAKMLDAGVGILPFGDSGNFPDTWLKSKIDEQFKSILSSIVIGMIVGEVAVRLAGNFGPWVFAAAVLSYIAYKGLTLASSWGSVEKLWESLIANFISIVISAFSGLEQFLPSAYHSVAAGVANIKNVAFEFLYKCIMIPINLYLLLTIWNRLIILGAV